MTVGKRLTCCQLVSFVLMLPTTSFGQATAVRVIYEGNPERSNPIGIFRSEGIVYASVKNIADAFDLTLVNDTSANRINISSSGRRLQLSEKSNIVIVEDTRYGETIHQLSKEVIRSGNLYSVPLESFLPLLYPMLREEVAYDADANVLRVGKPHDYDFSRLLMQYQPDGMLIRIPASRPLRQLQWSLYPDGWLEVTIQDARADVGAISAVDPQGFIAEIVARQSATSVQLRFRLSARISSAEATWEETSNEIHISVVTTRAGDLSARASRLPGTPADTSAPDGGSEGKPKVFVDCSEGCDQDYLKTELTFVHYVRDKDLADVHLLITTKVAGNGGKEYTLNFVGYRTFSGIVDTLTFITLQSDTDDLIRRKLAKTIKLGLMRYIARTPLAAEAEIDFPRRRTAIIPRSDPWDSWVFYTDVSTELQGEKLSKDVKFAGSFSANRVTHDLKLKVGYALSYAENRFDFSDATILSIARSEKLSSLLALGFGEHWSLGLFSTLSSSTYDNTKLWVNVAPAVEFDLYPYSEHSRRQFPISYRIGYIHAVYFDETIYDRVSESLFSHTLSIGLDLKQLWGTTHISLEGSQYLHDLRKNRLELDSKLSFRLVEGFSLWFAGTVSIVHDQLGLPKYGASPEQVLLRRRELETSYYYYLGIGLSYTFGSIYSNIVNPRFGN